VLALLLAAALQDPAAHARSLAQRLSFAHDAMLELRREAAALPDPALRAAVEAQILAPWLPEEAWAYAHLPEARKLLGEPKLTLPPPHKGDFAAAPGGPCEDGHHGYPGGLAVHSLADLLNGRAMARTYQHLYRVELHADQLAAAAIWHDSLKAATLPWKADGSCGPEPLIAGTPAHHVLGLAAGILRHLPRDLLITIAAAHGPEKACEWLQAAQILATGEKSACPPLRIEAYITHLADADYQLTGMTWKRYVATTRGGWARYESLIDDGNDVLLFNRSP
jgi:hypothetical protein